MTWILLNIALALVPLGNILRFDIGGGISILALDIVVILIFLSAFPFLFKRRSTLLSDHGFRFFLGFVGVGLVGLLVALTWLPASSVLVSGMYLDRFIAYASLYWIVKAFTKDQQRLLVKRMLASGLLAIVLGIGQYILYPDLRNLFYLGWDKHLGRMFGTYFDPNFAGALFVIVLGLLYKSKILYRWKPTPIVIIGLIGLIAVLLTYSRGTYVMLLASGVTFTFLTRKWKLGGLIFLALLLGVLLLPRDIGGEGVNLLRTQSIKLRLLEYTQAIDIVKDHPLIGVGYNTYRYAQANYGFLDLDSLTPDHSGAGVPNSYLFVLATTGIAGLSFYLGMWYSFLKKLYDKRLYVTFSIMIGLCAHALFENSLFYPFVMVLMFPLLAIQID